MIFPCQIGLDMQYVIEMLHYEYFIVLICLMLFYLNIEFDEVIVINSIMQDKKGGVRRIKE